MGVIANAPFGRQAEKLGRGADSIGSQAFDRQHQYVERRLSLSLLALAPYHREDDKQAGNCQPWQSAAQHPYSSAGSSFSEAELRQ